MTAPKRRTAAVKQHPTGGSTHNPKSLANLRRGGETVTHGATSEAIIRPIAEAYLAELQGEFPGASERVLKLQARRLAKLDRLASWLERKGELAHQRQGKVFPASTLEEQLTKAFLDTQFKLEAQQTGADPPAAPGDVTKLIAAMAAEHEASS